jgi:hypothetical protein
MIKLEPDTFLLPKDVGIKVPHPELEYWQKRRKKQKNIEVEKS